MFHGEKSEKGEKGEKGKSRRQEAVASTRHSFDTLRTSRN
jgi:hypothetical protein